MSSVLFTRLPFSVNDATLPQLDSSFVRVLVDYEISALDHWIFNSGESGFTGLVSATQLTNQDEAAPNAIIGANYIEFPMPIGQAYTTQFADSSLTEGTYTCVFKYERTTLETGDLAFLMGNLDTSGGAGGGCIYLGNDGGLNHNIRGMTAIASTTVLEEGKWYFIAGSWQNGYGLNLYIGKAAGSEFVAATNAGAKDNNENWNIGLGNPDYSNTNADSGSLKYGEFVLYDQFVGATDMPALYARAKERMANVGITVE